MDVVREVAKRPPGTTFCFSAGTYRITQPIWPLAGDDLVGQPGVVINGARVVSNWQHVGSVWVASGQTQGPTVLPGGGYSSYRYPQAIYGDDLYFDTHALTKVGVQVNGRVIGQPASAVGPGQYFFNYDTHEIYLGSNPTGHLVEAAIASAGIHSWEPRVTVTGMTVQMIAGSGIQTGQPNWDIEHNEVRFTHGTGIYVGGGAKVVSNYVHDNGTYGIAGSGNNILIQGNEVSRNNTALYYNGDGECYDAGGSKFTFTTNLVVKGNYFHDNLCIGIWLDINNLHSLIEGNRSDNNIGSGIMHEISYSATIRNNETSGNTRFGILIVASPNDSIYGNTISGNGWGGIRLNQSARTDWPSSLGPHLVLNTDIHDNTMTQPQSLSSEHEFGVSGTGFTGVVFSPTNRWHGNHYSAPSKTGAFFEGHDDTGMTWNQWLSSGHDAGSTLSTTPDDRRRRCLAERRAEALRLSRKTAVIRFGDRFAASLDARGHRRVVRISCDSVRQ